MLQGEWDAVTPESAEDVVIESIPRNEKLFIQVKTVEHPTQLWSPASLCQPDTSGRPETSILGRLITMKEFPQDARLILATNERVNVVLRPLTTTSSLDRSWIEADLERRLVGLQPIDRELPWCIERLQIEECENTADGLEAQVLRLEGAVAHSRGVSLLASELGDLLARVINLIQERSRGHEINTISREEFERLFDIWASEITSGTNLSMASQDQALRPKLESAGLTTEEIRRCEEMRIRFGRRRRSAVGHERSVLDQVADEIAMVCLGIKAARVSGALASGLPSLETALQKVTELHATRDWAAQGVPLATAYGVLHDITGRCQNRYVDD